MTHEQKLEAVRAKIIEAVPSIMELKFGSKIVGILGMYTSTPKEILGTYIGKNSTHELLIADEDKTVRYFSDQELKIIGRPIRLADVLCAMEGINLLYTIRADGLFMKRKGEIVHKMEYDFVYSDNGNIMWNLLNDDLNNQKPETISFLFNILCK